MCINPVFIKNRSTGQELYVPCGRCASCLNDAASSRCSKILNDYDRSKNYFFCTLTYDNDHVPYVFYKDIKDKVPFLGVYRGQKSAEPELYVPFHKYSDINYKLSSRHFLRNFSRKECVGVLQWRDLVLFHKRLRKYIKSNYGKSFVYSYYQVSEFGETFFRPHFHILFKTNISESQLYDSVRAVWSFCDWSTIQRGFEPALNPSSYLSFYLTSNLRLPLFYQIPEFKQKKSHSLGFGLVNPQFSFDSVISAAEKHDLTYDATEVRNFGVTVHTSLPLPKYVLSRYFPRFKGFCRLSFNEFYTLCHSLSGTPSRDPILIRFKKVESLESDRPSNWDYIYINNIHLYQLIIKLKYTYDDLKRTTHSINRVYSYCKENNYSFDQYLFYWYQVPTMLFSRSMIDSHKEVQSIIQYRNFYYNYRDLLYGSLCSPTLDTILNCSLDEVSSLSASDMKHELSSKLKLTKFSKNNKIKTHLL